MLPTLYSTETNTGKSGKKKEMWTSKFEKIY